MAFLAAILAGRRHGAGARTCFSRRPRRCMCRTICVALLGKYFCYALLALSIDLIWGYCGILSLGHGAFFALGGYAMGMYLMRQIGTRGVYANPELAGFHGVPELAGTAGLLVRLPALRLCRLHDRARCRDCWPFVFGWFAFRSRVTGVYLSIITQAMTFALMLGFFRNNFGFGGNNGLTDFKEILGFNVQAAGTRAALFAASCVALALGFVICRAIITSKFGKVLIAIRDAENRARASSAIGWNPTSCSSSRCRPAWPASPGALYVPQVGIINPSEFAPANSIEAVIWVAVGGRGTLIGADHRRHPGQLRQDHFHHRHAGALLAVPAGRAVRRRDAAAAARHCRHPSALLVGTPAAARAGEGAAPMPSPAPAE